MTNDAPTYYRTKQRQLVLDCFTNNNGIHLTIEDICNYLKENGTPVGTTTVYRHVQKLANEGIITKYNVDSESGACYQFSGDNCKMHFHLKCTKCSMLFHASCSFIESVEKHILLHHGFTVDNSRTVFYGICRDCLRKEKKSDKHHEKQKISK